MLATLIIVTALVVQPALMERVEQMVLATLVMLSTLLVMASLVVLTAQLIPATLLFCDVGCNTAGSFSGVTDLIVQKDLTRPRSTTSFFIIFEIISSGHSRRHIASSK